MLERTTIIRASAVAIALASSAGSARAQSYERAERVDTTVAMDRSGTLNVSIHVGRVSVTGVAGSTAHIRGTVARGSLDVRSRSTGVTVGTDPEGPLAGRVELDITVPIGTSVVLEGVSAPFTVRGVKGEVQTENVSGDVIVSDAAGRVDVESVSGDVSVTQVKGNVRAEAVNGAVTIADVDGEISVESVSGGISIRRSNARNVRAETVSGPVGYSGTFDPAGSYEFKTHAGRLTLGIPADAGATVSLETFSGTVDSEFPVTLESGRGRRGHESRFEFRIGNGRSRVVLETFSGDIQIQRGTSRDNQEQ